MEEVLDLYEEPYDPKRPMICFDEQPYQMLSDVRDPLPMKLGRPEHVDFEYQREGNAYVHMTFEPLGGFREVGITERRRGVEFARLMEHLVDDLYPEAEKIRVVLDNLSTHTGAAFYEAFPAQRARSLATTKIEFIYTPVHGSWLNMAEIELSVLGRQCLKRRIPDTKALRREVKAWQKERNQLGTSVDWRFTTEDARTKLRSLYPPEKV